MANFLEALKKTGIAEGGYTDHPKDNGNWTGGQQNVGVLIGTKYGVSAPVLSAYLGRTATLNDMVTLTTEVRDKIFQKNYWNPIRGNEIRNQQAANQIFDDAINTGVGPAIKKAQRVAKQEQTGKMTVELLNFINNG